MSAKPSHHCETDAGGFVLVAVLWIIAALATLASIYSIYAINTAAASHLPDDRLRAETSIRAGVELAAFQLLAASGRKPLSHGAFEARVGRTNIAVRYRSERGRVDLNFAQKEVLIGLFLAVGVSDTAASEYASRIVGWRTKGDPSLNEAEAAIYRAAGLAYSPRRGPFMDCLELALVLGLPPGAVERVLPEVTVFNGAAQIDVVNADPEVLAALPGMTPAVLQKVLQARSEYPEDRQRIIGLLGPAGRSAAIDPGAAFRADITVELKRGRRIRAEVVFKLDGGKDPYQIWYWRDDFDGPFF